MMRKILALLVFSVVTAVPVSVAAASPAGVAAPPPTVTLSAAKSGTSYDKKTLTAPAGTEFLLVFKNLSTSKHNVSLELGELEYGATLTIGKGGTATIFTLKKGVYHFYSSVGKDETHGMSGTLTVK
jgi:plastocyanin